MTSGAFGSCGSFRRKRWGSFDAVDGVVTALRRGSMASVGDIEGMLAEGAEREGGEEEEEEAFVALEMDEIQLHPLKSSGNRRRASTGSMKGAWESSASSMNYYEEDDDPYASVGNIATVFGDEEAKAEAESEQADHHPSEKPMSPPRSPNSPTSAADGGAEEAGGGGPAKLMGAAEKIVGKMLRRASGLPAWNFDVTALEDEDNDNENGGGNKHRGDSPAVDLLNPRGGSPDLVQLWDDDGSSTAPSSEAPCWRSGGGSTDGSSGKANDVGGSVAAEDESHSSLNLKTFPTTSCRSLPPAPGSAAPVNSSSTCAMSEVVGNDGEPTAEFRERRGCTAFLDLADAPEDDDGGSNNNANERGRGHGREQGQADSHRAEEERRRLRFASDLAGTARELLTEAYGRVPDRYDVSDYFVPPGAGTGLGLCVFDPAPGHPSREHTALWFAARMLAWAASQARWDRTAAAGLKCGMAGGTVETTRDVYDVPNVVGPSITLASRIADCALPGQVLACCLSVLPRLELDDAQMRMNSGRRSLSYVLDEERHEVIVKNNQTATVRAITGVMMSSAAGSAAAGSNASLGSGSRAAGRSRSRARGRSAHAHRSFGTTAVPENKWYLRLKPAELSYDPSKGAKAKVPPAELLRRHSRVAFVGVTHGQLASVFRQVLDADPTHTWDGIYLLFLSDDRLRWIAENEKKESLDDLVASKVRARRQLGRLLRGRVREGELAFLEYDRPFYCASYWDWDERGGFVHVSPLVWGADPRTCPAMNYHWIETDPGDDYLAYRDGLISLLQTSQPI